MKKKISFLILSCFLFSQTLSFGAVTLQDLRLPKNFYPAQSPFVKIVSVQENRQFPGFLTFSITSPHGSYIVHGLTNLRKCRHEIDCGEQRNTMENTGSWGLDCGVEPSKETWT